MVHASYDDSCQCWADSECPQSPCAEASCRDHLCELTALPAGPAPDQVGGDCAEVLCDGVSAEPEQFADGADLPSQQAGDCEVLSCDGVTPEPIAAPDPTDLPADKECEDPHPH